MVVAREIGIAAWGGGGERVSLCGKCVIFLPVLGEEKKKHIEIDSVIRPAHTPPSPLMKMDSRISSS